MSRTSRMHLAPIAAVLLGLVSIQGTAAPAQQCERKCLEGFVDKYLAALTARDATLAPLSKDIRFTENTVQLNLRQGLWDGATALGKLKIYVADPYSQQAGYIGTIVENGVTRLFAARLKIYNGEIAEIETIVPRNGMTTVEPAADLAEHTAHPIFSEALKPNERRSRSELVAAANLYFEGMDRNSSEGVPFDASCNRHENGVQTTNNPTRNSIAALSCKGQFDKGEFTWTVPERYFWMVDEERGLVFGSFVFRSQLPKDPASVPAGARRFLAQTPIVELFKIKEGRIYQIEAALGPRVPYGQRSGW